MIINIPAHSATSAAEREGAGMRSAPVRVGQQERP
jgi:hypothetical protein